MPVETQVVRLKIYHTVSIPSKVEVSWEDKISRRYFFFISESPMDLTYFHTLPVSIKHCQQHGCPYGPKKEGSFYHQ